MKCHPTNSHVFNSPLYLLDKTFNQAFRRPLRGPLSEQLFAKPPDQPEPLRLRSIQRWSATELAKTERAPRRPVIQPIWTCLPESKGPVGLFGAMAWTAKRLEPKTRPISLQQLNPPWSGKLRETMASLHSFFA
jgi:hypothetical protein